MMLFHERLESKISSMFYWLTGLGIVEFSVLLLHKDDFLTNGNSILHVTPLYINELYDESLFLQSFDIAKEKQCIEMHTVRRPYYIDMGLVSTFLLIGLDRSEAVKLSRKYHTQPFLSTVFWNQRTINVEWSYRAI